MSYHFVFYGSEGSGKGTQAKLLAEYLKLTLVGSGDLVRWAAETDKGMMGNICREALKTGKYVADSEMFVLWKRRLKEDDCKNGWILEGFPRNIDQAMFLEDKVEKYDQALTAVFYLKISEEESIRRSQLRKREAYKGAGVNHDEIEILKSRLAIYREGEDAVLDFYKKRGILVEINGEQAIEEVNKDIVRKVASYFK